MMDFGEALGLLLGGAWMTRKGWNGRGMWIALERPHSNSKMTRPYIYMCTVDSERVPWTASQADLLATDWEVEVL